MCRLAVEVPMTNFGVQLVLPDAFGEWFPTYTFTLTLGSRTLALQNGETAYFELPANEEQLTYQLSATNQDGEIFNENVRSLESTAIGTVYKITYSLSQNRLSQFSASFTH